MAEVHVPLLCDITRAGQLVELGVDSGPRPVQRSLGVQADMAKGESLRRQARDKSGAPKTGEAPASAPLASAAVCRLALGLLGLAPHEKPNTWAQVWLSFQDNTCQKLGLSSSVCAKADVNGKKANEDWQRQVLSHLRELLDQEDGEVPNVAAIPYATDGKPIHSNTIHEHLDLADFALERITSAVKALQDPERLNRPMLLQEYTEEMAEDVCKDLRQWLEQLSVLLSLYHVFLLEAERERRRFSGKLSLAESRRQAAEESKREAEQRCKVMEDRWNEEKMRQRAVAALGISLADKDAKIYSQREVDAMFKEWEAKYLKPLMQELSDLRQSQDKTLSRLASTRSLKRAGTVFDDDGDDDRAGGLGRAQLGLLQSALAASSDRVAGELSGLLSQLGDCLSEGAEGSDMESIVRAITALPALNPRIAGADLEAGAVVLGKNDVQLLQTGLHATADRVVGELSNRLVQLGEHFATGSPDLASIVKAIQALPLTAQPSGSESRSVGVNTTAAMVLPKDDANRGGAPSEMKGEFQAELSRMRAQLESELKAARAEAERQRLRAEEALRKLEAEARTAEGIISELRDKLKALEALLQRHGLGKEAAAALAQAGLRDFLAGRDVFERLYRDALRRMRAYAETQLSVMNRSAAAFLQTLHDLAAHPTVAVDAALELSASPLQVLGLASDPRSSKPSPMSSPRGAQQPQRSDAKLQQMHKFKTTGFEPHELHVVDEGRSARGLCRGRPMSRAATEGSGLGLGRGLPVKTLRQTLFQGPGLQDHPRDPRPLESPEDERPKPPSFQGRLQLRAEGSGSGSLVQESSGPNRCEEEAQMFAISSINPRPSSGQLLPQNLRPGTGKAPRAAPSRLVPGPDQRPSSSGGGKARPMASHVRQAHFQKAPTPARPSLQPGSRSFG